MSLIAILISGVGSGIAKAVLNVWLIDNPIEREISKNLVSILASKTTNVLTQNNVKRQLDELGDKIAENIYNLFEADKNNLTKKQKEKIASLAGIAIHNLKINSELLLINNLDPLVIERLLIENAFIPNTESDLINFTPDQKSLYQLIISESATLIVDIASNLPSFTEKSIQEILKRQTFISETGTEILNEVRKIRDSIKDDSVDKIKFETDYRRNVVRKLDHLQLFGVDVSSSNKRYKLSLAYISLTVDSKDSKNESELINIEKCLAENNRLVVKGLAGSGKTTLLQWIAIKSAGHNMPEELEDWNFYIPFFIRLRQYSARDLPTPEMFINDFSSVYGDAMPVGWTKEKLAKGEATLLVDGLDEIESIRRDEVKEWIYELNELYPNIKIIITSRPYAIEKQWLEEIGFVDVHLQDMDLQDLDSFVDHWHDAALEMEEIEESRVILTELKVNIKLELRQNKNLLKLATNPLLCALLCALNRERLSKLPTNRIELYQACINMFFRRDIERNVSLKDYNDIGSKPKELILSDLAYWLIRNGWSEANLEEVEKRVYRKKVNIHGIPENVTAEGIVKYFVERSGILRKPIESKIDFPHRTFEEYFAAMAIVAEGDYGLLLSNIHDDQWREVILLTCGLARTSEAETIVKDIMNAGDESVCEKEYFHFLAALCSEMVYELSSKVRHEVEYRFRSLIPPKTITQGKEISKLGDLALPYLTYKKTKFYSVTKLKPVIRTLAFIGEEAYPILKEFTVDKRIVLKQEILEGGKYANNPISYGKEILSDFKEIILIGRFSLDLFTHMQQIYSLDIDVDSNKSKDISVIGRLINLEYLALKYWRKSTLDITPLKNCKKLKFLILHNSKIKDLTVLKHCTNLENLNLAGISKINLTCLVSLKRLQVLTIDSFQFLNLNVELIRDLNELKEIRLFPGSNNRFLQDDHEKFLTKKEKQMRTLFPSLKINS